MGGGAAIIIWILVFFGIFYFLAIRPQRRQKQQHQEMVSMLKKGDEVVTIGGMFGTITAIGDDWVELEVAKRTRVRYLKRAISSITASTRDEDEDEYIEADDDDVTEEAGDETPASSRRPPKTRPRRQPTRRRPRRPGAPRGAQGLTTVASTVIVNKDARDEPCRPLRGSSLWGMQGFLPAARTAF